MRPDDPRATITPDSFTVAPELLGLPLARPARRACAMLIDLIAVGLLANAGFVLLAFAAALALWRASSSQERTGLVRAGARNGLRFAAALAVFVGIVQVADLLPDRESGGDAPVVVDASSEGTAEDRASLVAALIGEIDDTTARNAILAEVRGALPDSLLLADETGALMRRLVQERAENRELRQELARTDRAGVIGFMRGLADDLGIGFGWGALYFTALLALWKGQTPGKRLVHVRVIRLDGRPLGWWFAFERFGGYAASLSTGLLGFLQILWDRNRQGLHDKAVETVVIRVMPDDAKAAASPPAPR
jgi:hypothetical protein